MMIALYVTYQSLGQLDLKLRAYVNHKDTEY